MNKNNMHQIFAHYIDNFEMLNNAEHSEYYKWQVCHEFRPLMDEALVSLLFLILHPKTHPTL